MSVHFRIYIRIMSITFIYVIFALYFSSLFEHLVRDLNFSIFFTFCQYKSVFFLSFLQQKKSCHINLIKNS